MPAVHTFRSDVSDPAAIGVLYREITERFPALDTLINNAGVMRNIKLNQQNNLADLTSEIDTNLKGPIRMIQQFLPHLETKSTALIVNVTSGLAFVPFPAAPIYSASKAALRSYTQSLRMQLRGSNVTVVELAPPGVETPLFRAEFAEEMKNQKPMSVSVLAGKAIKGIESGSLEIRPGLANLLKLMSRIAPNLILRQLANVSATAAQPKSERARAKASR